MCASPFPKKRQEIPVGPQGLWIIATPIGNVSDLSPRARAALELADILLCEDTRRTAKLLSYLGIEAGGRLERFDAHTEGDKVRAQLERLQQGATAAIVSDAGTPAISDPGAELVRAAHESGIPVTPIPGPSAVTALISAAGLSETSFCFRGFFPRKTQDRLHELDQLRSCAPSRTYAWFESPHRIDEALAVFAGVVPGAYAVVGKELTKLHERLFCGTLAEVSVRVREEVRREGEVGEWCFLVQFPKESAAQEQQENPWKKTLICLLDCGVSPSSAAKKVSQVFGVGKNEIYQEALRLNEKKSHSKG